MPVRLLGTIEVVDPDQRSVEIGGVQPRVVLAMLAAADGRVVSTDALLDAIWGDDPPPSATGTLQTYVSRLRRALSRVDAGIVRHPAGYVLEITRGQVDLHRFESLADEGRAALDAGDARTARERLVAADALWRGPALLEVRDRPQIIGVAQRLDERRLAAVEDRITADLELGRHAAAAAELTQLVADHPYREGVWALLALARYRSGQQADALRAIADARRVLVDELGVEPGARLRELEARILTQDAALDVVQEPSRPSPSSTESGSSSSAAPSMTASRPAGVERAPMVGRVDELATLRRALDETMSGRPGVVVVQGEAGVGKTRLVDELAAAAETGGARVVWGRSLEGDATPAYWPWLGVLRPLRAVHRDVAPTVEQLLDATGARPDVHTVDSPVLLDGVLRLLTDAADQPLVVVFEDIQWAGAESLDLLAHVVAGIDAGRVLLVLTFREGDDSDHPTVVAALAAASRRPGTHRIRVTGLDASETDSLLAQVHGRSVDTDVARVIHHRADGNPFYTIELMRLLASEGLTEDAELASRVVPAGVRDVVRQRLDRLPAATNDLLQLAAVAGRDIDVAVLARAAGRPIEDCLDDLDAALVGRLLVGETSGWLRFSHALVREVIVDGLSALRRARTNLRIADAIEAAGTGAADAERLAEHLWVAAPIGVGQRAADALDRAAEVAIGRFAVRAATDLLERSLELRRTAGSTPAAAAAELSTLTTLVWTLSTQHGYRGGMHHLARGAELARVVGRQDIELAMLWGEWATYDTACDVARARPLAERFRNRAEDSDDPLVAMRGFTAWGIQCWHDGQLGASHESFGRAAAARERLLEEPGDLPLVAIEVVVLGSAFQLYVAEQVGELPEPEAAFARVVDTVTDNLAVAMLWCFAASSALSAGDGARLERCTRRVIEAEAGETLGFWGNQARMYLGAVMVGSGRVDEGRELFATGMEAYRAVGICVGLPLMLAGAATAEVLVGDLAAARAHLDAARDGVEMGERYAAPLVMLAAADLAEASGAPAAEVLRERRAAESLAREQGAVAVAARAAAAQLGACWLDVGHLPASPSASSPSSA